MTKITMEGEYQTRDGRPVRVLCVDAHIRYQPVIVLVQDASHEVVGYRCSDGRVISTCDSDGDLIPVPKRHKRTVWVNLYPDPIDDDAHPSRDLANDCAGPDRIACLKLDLDFAEGVGL